MLLFPLPVAAAETAHWGQVVERISKAFDDAEAQAAAGQADTARETVEGAYFDIFELSRMEVIERLHLGMTRVTEVEDLFHKAEDASNDPKAMHKVLADLRKALKADARKLDRDHVKPDREVSQ
ncbi:MAG TPA: hypothetical protein VM661_04070 [Candidatus Sulfotelmatobacter sp.]|nr:hypothetical protein [Candidatus Sulfotelmatobacter sp.]